MRKIDHQSLAANHRTQCGAAKDLGYHCALLLGRRMPRKTVRPWIVNNVNDRRQMTMICATRGHDPRSAIRTNEPNHNCAIDRGVDGEVAGRGQTIRDFGDDLVSICKQSCCRGHNSVKLESGG
jgi:hypothetical protein